MADLKVGPHGSATEVVVEQGAYDDEAAGSDAPGETLRHRPRWAAVGDGEGDQPELSRALA